MHFDLLHNVFALGTLQEVPLVLGILLNQIAVPTIGALSDDRFVVGNPFAIRISGAGIKWAAFLTATCGYFSLPTLRTFDSSALRTGILAFGIGGAGDESAILPGSFHQGVTTGWAIFFESSGNNNLDFAIGCAFEALAVLTLGIAIAGEKLPTSAAFDNHIADFTQITYYIGFFNESVFLFFYVHFFNQALHFIIVILHQLMPDHFAIFHFIQFVFHTGSKLDVEEIVELLHQEVIHLAWQ